MQRPNYAFELIIGLTMFFGFVYLGYIIYKKKKSPLFEFGKTTASLTSLSVYSIIYGIVLISLYYSGFVCPK